MTCIMPFILFNEAAEVYVGSLLFSLFRRIFHHDCEGG